jgi:hypothetical protein
MNDDGAHLSENSELQQKSDRKWTTARAFEKLKMRHFDLS